MAASLNSTNISSLMIAVKGPKCIFKTKNKSGKIERQANVNSSWLNFLKGECNLKIPERGVRVCSSAYSNNNTNTWNTTNLDEKIENFLRSLRSKPREKHAIRIRIECCNRRRNRANWSPQPGPSTSRACRAQRESPNTYNWNGNMEYPGFENADQNGDNGINDYMNPHRFMQLSAVSRPEDQEHDLREEGIQMEQIKTTVQIKLEGVSNATLLRVQDEIKRLKNRSMRESETESAWQRNFNRAPYSCRLLEMLFDV